MAMREKFSKVVLRTASTRSQNLNSLSGIKNLESEPGIKNPGLWRCADGGNHQLLVAVDEDELPAIDVEFISAR
jgi:hypothetical protein